MNANIWLIFLKLSITYLCYFCCTVFNIIAKKYLLKYQEVWKNNREVLRLNNSFKKCHTPFLFL